MRLIVGLGNPGPKYERTRHNIGFLMLDELARQAGGSVWKPAKKANALIATAELGGHKLLLAKPQTYMNNSGLVVQQLIQEYLIKPYKTWVIHDEIDLDAATVKGKFGGSAGSKGIQSVIEHIGPDFHRVRVGIGQNDRTLEPSEVYVLRTMPEGEIVECLEHVPEVLSSILNAAYPD